MIFTTRPASAGTDQMWFEIHESRDADHTLRLKLVGELDVAAAGLLRDRLRELNQAACPARLDLSQLEFIDCGGLDAIIIALLDARRVGCPLEVDPLVSPSVERMIRLGDTAELFWPLQSFGRSNVVAPFGSGRWGRWRGAVYRPAPS